MADEKMARAQKVYADLCAAIERRDWTYEKDEPELVAHFSVKGEDLPMKMIIKVDVDRQLVRLLSPLPFEMKEDKRLDGAIAACVASYGLPSGSFDYDFAEGRIVFRITETFLESEIGDGLFQYMISMACAMVDRYNDRFFALNMGMMSIGQFMEAE